MMNKLILIFAYVMLAYTLPVIWKPELLFSNYLIVLIAMTIILVFSNPPVSVAQATQHKKNDRFSVLIILAGILFTQIFSVLEWAYFRSSYHHFSWNIFTGAGIILLIGGTAFRLWSIRLLGKYFTATVQTHPGQQIITSGPYRIIRHPSYFGAYLVITGTAFLLHAYTGIFFSAIVMLFIYSYRINTEEKTLEQAFGHDYKVYQKRTKKLIPFIF